MMFLARFWHAAVSITGLLTGSCVPAPESYPPPEQHRPFHPFGFHSKHVASAGDVFSEAAFLGGFQPAEAGIWRWTQAEPELRFELESLDGFKLFYEFVVHERTFQDTGPVSVVFFVNERYIGRQVYDSPGEKKFEKAIPDGWLRPETRVRVRIENPWRGPDGEILGFLFIRAGFVR